LEARAWDRRVAREVEHQARIEAAFDRTDAFDRLGDAELALEALEEASALSGGLTPTYRAKRLRLCREIAHHREAGRPMTLDRRPRRVRVEVAQPGAVFELRTEA
jgi:hypothetical protein